MVLLPRGVEVVEEGRDAEDGGIGEGGGEEEGGIEAIVLSLVVRLW